MHPLFLLSLPIDDTSKELNPRIDFNKTGIRED